MTQYIKYRLDNGDELWVEVSGELRGPMDAGIGDKLQEAKQSFDQALESCRLSALQLHKKFRDLQADEVEVKFGLKAMGEVGNNIFAVGKVGVESNYEVTLKWGKKPSEDKIKERIRNARRHRQMHKSGL